MKSKFNIILKTLLLLSIEAIALKVLISCTNDSKISDYNSLSKSLARQMVRSNLTHRDSVNSPKVILAVQPNRICSQKFDTTMYFTFMEGVKTPFEPKWDLIYVEFNYNNGITNLTEQTIDSIRTQFKNDLDELGLIRLDPKSNVYKIVRTAARPSIIKRLSTKKEVQGLEVIYNMSGNTRFFSRSIEVFFETGTAESEINSLADKLKLTDFSIMPDENEKSLLVRFSLEQMFSYEFLEIANQMSSEPKVVKVYTFNIQCAVPN